MTTKSTVTRRQLIGMAAGAMAADTTNATAAMEEDDPRTALVARQRSVPFTPEQRTAMPAQWKDMDETGATLRKFALPEGGGEPGFQFQPVRGGVKAGTSGKPKT